MSNHAGSYMLNEVITILDRHQAFAGMDETALRAVMREIVEMAKNEYDCNQGEILEGVAQQFHLCYYCLADNDNPADELCPTCRVDWDRTD
jgi:hypothetical protein